MVEQYDIMLDINLTKYSWILFRSITTVYFTINKKNISHRWLLPIIRSYLFSQNSKHRAFLSEICSTWLFFEQLTSETYDNFLNGFSITLYLFATDPASWNLLTSLPTKVVLAQLLFRKKKEKQFQFLAE